MYRCSVSTETSLLTTRIDRGANQPSTGDPEQKNCWSLVCHQRARQKSRQNHRYDLASFKHDIKTKEKHIYRSVSTRRASSLAMGIDRGANQPLTLVMSVDRGANPALPLENQKERTSELPCALDEQGRKSRKNHRNDLARFKRDI